MAYVSPSKSAAQVKRGMRGSKYKEHRKLLEPTSKKSGLKISSSGNQSAFEPKGGYKDKRA